MTRAVGPGARPGKNPWSMDYQPSPVWESRVLNVSAVLRCRRMDRGPDGSHPAPGVSGWAEGQSRPIEPI